jgi:hypothetical protein
MFRAALCLRKVSGSPELFDRSELAIRRQLRSVTGRDEE